MSDEHEHHNHPHAFAFQIGPTPEQVEQMRMGAEASAHDVRAFLDGLNADQLQMLGRIFRVIAGEEAVASYYVGMTLGLLHAKFNVCLACGKNHDEALADMTGTDEPPLPKSDAPWPEKQDALSSLTVFHQKIDERDRNMQEWELDLFIDDDRSLDPKVICKNCRTVYSSLSDRMLRKPGKAGCATCIEKEKWG